MLADDEENDKAAKVVSEGLVRRWKEKSAHAATPATEPAVDDRVVARSSDQVGLVTLPHLFTLLFLLCDLFM